MENLLYYPYINLPKTDWTLRTLLYYDQIGSIVPAQYFHEPGYFEPFMKEMVDNELVKLINPLHILENWNSIFQPFIDYINGKNFPLKLRQTHFHEPPKNLMHCNHFDSRIHNGKFTYSGNKIHTGKFENEILYQLEQAGLAVQEHNSPWYIVESHTANELMTFLASVIGNKIQYQPVTDKLPMNPFAKIQSTDDFSLYIKREAILKQMIPYPEEIDISKLNRFKTKHNDLLKVFRNRVELIVFNPSIDIESPYFQESINELKHRKEELSAKMNENRLGEIIFGTICGITGAAIGLSTADTTGAVLSGLPGFANAIYSALKIERAENTFDQSGLKYLALVDKRIRKSNG